VDLPTARIAGRAGRGAAGQAEAPVAVSDGRGDFGFDILVGNRWRSGSYRADGRLAGEVHIGGQVGCIAPITADCDLSNRRIIIDTRR